MAMSNTPLPSIDSEGPPPLRRRRTRRLLLIPPALVLIAAVTLAGAWHFGLVTLPNLFGRPAVNGVHDNNAAISLYTVTRRDLSSQSESTGTLGYAGSYSIVSQATGILTWLPAVGQVISEGQVLYDVNGSPVVLLYGSTPAYRDLALSTTGTAFTGPDVRELNADLVALGYVSSSDLSPSSDEFTEWTEYGVEKLQAALGEPQTGSLALGQVVFLPTAARITAVQGTLGGPAGGGALLTATSTARQVTVNLDANDQSQIAVGDQVQIDLPNGKTTPGTVTSVGTVATSGSSGATVQVLITPTDAAATGTLDQASVDVYVTAASVKDALVVPIQALLARAGGSYAVEVVNPNGVHHLVAVTLGLFDDADGLVQVTDTTLEAGDRVVEPSS